MTADPHASGASVDDAYTAALQRITHDDPQHMTTEVTDPIHNVGWPDDPTNVNAWADYLWFGGRHVQIGQYDTDKQAHERAGTSGWSWIAGRLDVMFNGQYRDRMGEQVIQVADRLRAGMHGSSTNALVIQVYHPDIDLERATVKRPRASGVACLTQVQFRPSRDHLDLHAVFRSQWWDLKAYGNLLSLCGFLAMMCDETGYEPGTVVSRCNNVVLEDTDRANALARLLESTSPTRDR